jgi:hypothetical protein
MIYKDFVLMENLTSVGLKMRETAKPFNTIDNNACRGQQFK